MLSVAGFGHVSAATCKPLIQSPLALAAHPSRPWSCHHHHHRHHPILDALTNACAVLSGPDQLDLGWLHTLAGQMASLAFTPPRCEFEVLEGRHTQAVIDFTTNLCRALERTSSALMASGMQSLALDLATQVSLHCLFTDSRAFTHLSNHTHADNGLLT